MWGRVVGYEFLALTSYGRFMGNILSVTMFFLFIGTMLNIIALDA
jgi:hypothetical protein